MGKKKIAGKYMSKGERPNVSKKYKQKRDDSLDLFGSNGRSFDAYIKGKKAYITVPNPNPNNTKERWIKLDAKDHFNNKIGTPEAGTKYKDKFRANRHFMMINKTEKEEAV